MSKLTQNTTDLQAILDAVNALPEAGSGGVETCSVICTNEGMIDLLAYTTITNGICETVVLDTVGSSEELTVVKGTTVFIVCANGTSECDISENISKHTKDLGYNIAHIFTVSGDGNLRLYSDIEVELE